MDAPAPDDADLLRRFAASGDQAAFAQVVARHQDLVRRACLRRLGPADAEDAAQAVFIILSRKPAEAVRHGCLPAWLQRTVHHVACNAVRRRASRHAAETRASQEARMSSDPEPAQVDDPERLRGQLDAAVERLPEAQRQVVVLHYFSGLDHEAVARELGCPINTVYTRLHRALARLRGLLAPQRAGGLSSSAVAVLLTDSGRLPLATAPPIDPQAASAAAQGLATTTLQGMLMTKIALFAAGIALTATCAVAGMALAGERAAPPAASSVMLPAPRAAVASEPPQAPEIQVPELVPEFGVEPEVDNWGYNHRGDGLAVRSVTVGKTADRMGIRAGDVLLRLNGRAIDNLNLLRRVEMATRPGDGIAVDLLRDGRAVTLNGVMGGRTRTDDEIPLPFARFRDSDPLRLAFYAGADPQAYEADHDPTEPGSLRYRTIVTEPKGFGTWMTKGPGAQRLQQLVGKRVCFSAEIRTADVAKDCGLWIRTDGFVGDTDCFVVPSFDNMSDRSITGTTPWRRHAVVVDLPAGTTGLMMGIILDGSGTIWLRDAMLEEVDDTVASTTMQKVCDEGYAEDRKRWEEVQQAKAEAAQPAHPPKEPF